MFQRQFMKAAAPFTRAALLLGASLITLTPSLAQADSGTLTPLGSLGGNGGGSSGGYESGVLYSYSNMLSADGSTVVGDSYLADNSTDHAFRWTTSGGMVDLGTLGGSSGSYAAAVSGNGSVVVGGSYLAGNSTYDAFRWTQATGMVDLGSFGGSYGSWAYGVSANGSVVVGDSYLTGNTAQNAFRWTQGTGMVDIDNVGGTYSYAYAVSADGSIVVGGAQFHGVGPSDAFRWTQATGMVDLGNLGATGRYGSEALAISADGSTIVGDSYLADNSTDHAIRWTQATGMVDLGTLGGTNSWASAVSATGKIIVGTSEITGNSTYDAFRWTQATGMQDLNTLLANAGVNMSGIQLQYAYGISQNGLYIAGYGLFSGITEAYLVYYNDGTVDGFVTASDVQASTQNLSANQRAAAIESRSTANELLGMTRPMDTSDYTYAGGMFGSAVGYAGGQYAAHGLTLLGGFAYGAQDYPGIRQSDAPTVAAAARYTFDVPYDDEGTFFHPFVEIGGWVTPRQDLTLSRSYTNAAGTSTGTGSTNAISWAEYGRTGLVWNLTGEDQLTGYGELGQQYMAFNGYSEQVTADNPFPASVGTGVLRLDIARVGTSWTHHFFDVQLDDDLNVPISFTLAGAAAHTISEHTGLTATVAGIGSATATNTSDTWGEFGGRLEAQMTDNVALDLDLTGTTGSGALGTVLHGGAGLTYRF